MQEGLEQIGRAAFSGCTNLTSVTIPASVAKIDRNAFEGCTNIKRVNITDIAAWCAITFENEQANPLWYGADLYLNGEKVTDLVIPDGVKQIEYYAFAGCRSLTGVKMANTVDLLAPGAFNNCENLKEAILSPRVTIIFDGTFSGCKSLTTVTFYSSVQQINYSAFWNCAALSDIYYGGTQERWDNMPSSWREEYFKNAKVHFVDLCGGSHIWDKGNLKKVPTHLESGEKTYTCFCCSLTKDVTIPPIAGPAADETVIQSVWLGYTPHDIVWIITSNGTLALGGTGEMINYEKNQTYSDHWRKGKPTRIIINEGITRIGENAFYGMNTVTEVVLPKSLESIGDGAFGGIDTFEKIKFHYGGTKEMWYANKGLSGVLYPVELVFDSNGILSTEPTTKPTTEPTTVPTDAEPTMGSTAEPTTTPATAPTSDTVPTATAAAESTPVPAESTAATEQANSGKKGGSGWLITGVVVAVLAAGGAAAVVILKKKQK